MGTPKNKIDKVCGLKKLTFFLMEITKIHINIINKKLLESAKCYRENVNRVA